MSRRLSSSASLCEFTRLFVRLCIGVCPKLAAGEALSRIACPVELALSRLTGPDSGVNRCEFFAGREECLDEFEVAGGVKPPDLVGAGGVCSASV